MISLAVTVTFCALAGLGAAQTAPACETSSDFEERAAEVTAECCDEASESCIDGYPSTCNAGCMAVLLPMRDSCEAGFLSRLSGFARADLADAIDTGAARCSRPTLPCESFDDLQAYKLAVAAACCDSALQCPGGDLPTVCSTATCTATLIAMQGACHTFFLGQGVELKSIKKGVDDIVAQCDICGSAPCLNGGACSPASPSSTDIGNGEYVDDPGCWHGCEGFVCTCAGGFAGTQCETPWHHTSSTIVGTRPADDPSTLPCCESHAYDCEGWGCICGGERDCIYCGDRNGNVPFCSACDDVEWCDEFSPGWDAACDRGCLAGLDGEPIDPAHPHQGGH